VQDGSSIERKNGKAYLTLIVLETCRLVVFFCGFLFIVSLGFDRECEDVAYTYRCNK
jgi:hypothetical protein